MDESLPIQPVRRTFRAVKQTMGLVRRFICGTLCADRFKKRAARVLGLAAQDWGDPRVEVAKPARVVVSPQSIVQCVGLGEASSRVYIRKNPMTKKAPRKRTHFPPELIFYVLLSLQAGDFQHDIADDLECNQGRLSEFNTGRRAEGALLI